jgi:hypothetical protein
MANAYKIVGQTSTAAGTVDLYTVPASTEFVGTLFIAETGGTAQTARVAVASGGSADAADQYILRNFSIPAYDALQLPGFALAATDVVRVYGSTTDVVFTLMGVEVS